MRRGRPSTACCATTRRTAGDCSPLPCPNEDMYTCFVRGRSACGRETRFARACMRAHSPRLVVGVVDRLHLLGTPRLAGLVATTASDRGSPGRLLLLTL